MYLSSQTTQTVLHNAKNVRQETSAIAPWGFISKQLLALCHSCFYFYSNYFHVYPVSILQASYTSSYSFFPLWNKGNTVKQNKLTISNTPHKKRYCWFVLGICTYCTYQIESAESKSLVIPSQFLFRTGKKLHTVLVYAGPLVDIRGFFQVLFLINCRAIRQTVKHNYIMTSDRYAIKWDKTTLKLCKILLWKVQRQSI